MIADSYVLDVPPIRWDNPPDMTRGERIEQRRKAVEWSQTQLAAAADVSLDTVGRAERGDKRVKASTYGKLERALRECEADQARQTPGEPLLHTGGPSHVAAARRPVSLHPSTFERLAALAAELYELVAALEQPGGDAGATGVDRFGDPRHPQTKNRRKHG